MLLSQGASDGGGYDAMVDCWACGCIVFELLCGSPPFTAKSEDVLFYKILENSIEFPKEVFGSLSEHVAELILGLTATATADRMTAAAAVKHPWLAAGFAARAGAAGALADAPSLPLRQDTRSESAERRAAQAANGVSGGGDAPAAAAAST